MLGESVNNIPKLIKICDEATPGNWISDGGEWDVRLMSIHPESKVESQIGELNEQRDGNFIAQFNPCFIKQLLERVQDYEDALKLIRTGQGGRFKANDVLEKHGVLND